MQNQCSYNICLFGLIESEVNAATTTQGEGSSTWTGWAVSSLTSRLYRPGAPGTQPPAGTPANAASTKGKLLNVSLLRQTHLVNTIVTTILSPCRCVFSSSILLSRHRSAA